MISDLTAPAGDAIIGLMQRFNADPRAGKIDLGVGVYRDAHGNTPIMRAVRSASRRLWEGETTKSYTGLAGTPEFNAAMASLILGDSVPRDRIASVATPGGTGAVRQALELVRIAHPDLTVWIPDPTWPNHRSILAHLGIASSSHAYLDRASGRVDFAAMMDDLGRTERGDVLLLHGCCHNPSGANLAAKDWAAVARFCGARGVLPLVDLAYQGFGDGLEEDAAGVRTLASALPELLIASSCSKNFGIYRERTGALIALATDAGRALALQANLTHLNRQNYSFPPDHGARLVTMILGDDGLRADWMAELESMRLSMLSLRKELAGELARATNSSRFDFIAGHRGMFSLTGLSGDEVATLERDHAVYMVADGRMNVAGLTLEKVPEVARRIAKSI